MVEEAFERVALCFENVALAGRLAISSVSLSLSCSTPFVYPALACVGVMLLCPSLMVDCCDKGEAFRMMPDPA